ncbi:MAG: 16S rRNA (cytidine(1402)-2'-O)-methyltransferase [Polyangiaceae bacterium]
MSSPGTLFVVATPIGNLGDVSARTASTLAEADVVVAEDTRRARQLLSHLGITGKRVERLDAHAGAGEVARVAARVVAGERVALVTDAGTPAVSDPGQAAVRAVVDAGARVVPIPGPSAVLAALVASGLGGDGGFRFVGFLPRKGPPRRAALATICATPETTILFESPQRLRETLSELADAMPDREACVARELTKMHEELVRGTCRSLAGDDREWIGEIALVLGSWNPDARAEQVDDARLDARIDEGLARGDHARTLAEKLAAWSGRPKREVYERVITRKPR